MNGVSSFRRGRRRTDLIRWEMFTEKWWDHEPSDASEIDFCSTNYYWKQYTN